MIKGIYKKSYLTPKLVIEKLCPTITVSNSVKTQNKFNPTLKYGEYPVLSHQPIPSHIVRPPYAQNLSKKDLDRYYSANLPFFEVKNLDQIAKMRAAAKIAARCLQVCKEYTQKGVTADSVDRKAHDFIVDSGAYPSGVNFHGFPRAICISVNEVACHGIPNTRPFQDGDIVSYDCTIFYDGVFGDCAGTFIVGNVPDVINKLVSVSRDCVHIAVDHLKPGYQFSKLAELVTNYANRHGFSVIKDFGGHFIGERLHMPPMIQFHHPSSTPGVAEEGHVFTIEPIICQGDNAVYTWDDGWTIATVDNGFCSQFEHTVLVTADGCEVLTSA
ncbi:methionine aminopeptidase [Theileria orientalis strain Shintoku]|uniref:Methionine aminopeptidase n=1 Tax=Theileria orientalis strain Shintoku TaxID=869250 RepID=J4CDV0_THEOR|nr:methionine aminopeptidase [Theileria orientalis strain Shintoku]BAM41777.1 methionine aminopeptidase [Theileria orientalis strain Shintoku]|eukprot:XP_009692078.1 methionine aminopeptidase [Theileria orientalis strain Shintoku]